MNLNMRKFVTFHWHPTVKGLTKAFYLIINAYYKDLNMQCYCKLTGGTYTPLHEVKVEQVWVII